MGKFALEINKKGEPNLIDEIDQSTVIHVFDKLNSNGSIPKKTLKMIEENDSIKWKIPKK